ncbi:hypothetical protein V8D89_001807 [Ganoderma adspersum]
MPTNPSQGEVLPQPEKDKEFWFEDGNVVVVAEDTAFKLYKGVLSSVSPVFKDLFSMPQPEPVAETTDGCPVPGFSLLRHDSRPSFRMLAAICRIGHKYQAAEAVETASERIVLFFEKACSEGTLMNAGWEYFWASYQRNIGIRVVLTDTIEAV